VNVEQITDIMTLRYHPTKSTLIPPLTIDDFSPESTFNLASPEHNINQIDKMIKTSIEKTIKGDTISLALSGGVDSTIVLSKIREVKPNINIHCITIGFYENDTDFIAAKEIAKTFDCKFHGKIVENPLETLPKQVSLSHEPRWNTFWYYVVEEATKYSDMLVTGDGGDEVFAGYVFRYKNFIQSLDQNDSWMDRATKYLNCHNRDWVPDQQKMFTTKMNFSWQNIYNKLRTYFDNSLDPINQVLLADFNGKLLHDWLPVNERIHKHFNIGGYSPLMNIDMAKFAAYIPYHQKYDKHTNEGKIPLRRLLEKSGHDDLLVKEKKGYAPDLVRLWNNYGRRICERYLLSSSNVVKYKIINPTWLSNAFELADNNDMRYVSKLLSVLSLEIWCQMYISHAINPNLRL
jgi:asparagine synthase (glutamine-hydrolysing)